MRKKTIFHTPFFIFLFLFVFINVLENSHPISAQPPEEQEVKIPSTPNHEGDLELTGNQVLEITGDYWIKGGTIRLWDNAVLKVKKARFFVGGGFYPVNISVDLHGQAQFIAEDSLCYSVGALTGGSVDDAGYNAYDDSKVVMKNTKWCGGGYTKDRVTVEFEKAETGVVLADQVETKAVDSYTFMFDIYLEKGKTVLSNLSTGKNITQDFSLPSGSYASLQNCDVDGFVLWVPQGADVTLENIVANEGAYGPTHGIEAQLWFENCTAHIDGLPVGQVKNYTLNACGTKIQLKNAYIMAWGPGVGGKSNVKVTNAGLIGEFGVRNESVLRVENSKTYCNWCVPSGNSILEFINTEIGGSSFSEITATENARVRIINSTLV